MKEMVVIEYIDPIDVSKVAVISYDNYEIGSILEVCSKSEASEHYDIVGELRNGDVVEFDTDDYDEESDYDMEEDDEFI